MKRTSFRIGVGTFIAESCPFHFVAHERTGNAHLFATGNNHLLTHQQFLGHKTSKAAQHVISTIDDNYFFESHILSAQLKKKGEKIERLKKKRNKKCKWMDPEPWGMGTNVKALGSGVTGGQEDPSVAMRGVKGRDDTTGVTIEEHWMNRPLVVFFATMCGQTRRALVPGCLKRVDLVQFRTVVGGGVGCETFPELIERG